jgi:anti-sigma regulatory factor (Ser/Thr protein kinase)
VRDVKSEFDDQVTAIVAARRFAAEVLGGDDRLHDVLVIVSELASNSVRHAHTGFSVSVEREDDLVRIEVSDEGDGWPVVAPRAEVVQPGGLGLHLVAALADRWGAMERPRGKVVWAELDRAHPRWS